MHPRKIMQLGILKGIPRRMQTHSLVGWLEFTVTEHTKHRKVPMKIQFRGFSVCDFDMQKELCNLETLKKRTFNLLCFDDRHKNEND